MFLKDKTFTVVFFGKLLSTDIFEGGGCFVKRSKVNQLTFN